MKQLLNEVKRMQQLAGVIKESPDSVNERSNPPHFFIQWTDSDENKAIQKLDLMKKAANKAGMNIKVNIIDPQEEVEVTLPGGNNFSMQDAEKMAKILDKLDIEWQDTIGLGFSGY
jgi:hypothetical protein